MIAFQKQLLLGAVVLFTGCASLSADGLWLAPPLNPPPMDPESDLPRSTVAGLGTASAPIRASQWSAGQPLTLGHVFHSVEKEYPLLSIARQEQTIAEARQLSAMGAFDLNVDAGATWAATGFFEHNTAYAGVSQRTGLYGLRVWGGYRLGAGDFDPTFDGKRRTNHGGEFSVGASLPLLRGGSIDGPRRDLMTSTLDREIARSQVASRRLAFDREAAAAYWQWAAAGERVKVVADLLKLAETRQQGVERRVRRGDLPQIEATDNERLVVGRRDLAIAARRQLEKAAITLSLFLRDAEGNPVRPPATALPSGFPSPAQPVESLQVDVATALANRPDLRKLRQEIGRANVDLRYAENQRLPQLDVFVTGSQDRDRSRPTLSKGEFELTAGLVFSFPLQNRSARGKVLANRAKIEQLTEQARFLRDRLGAQVRDGWSELNASYQRVAQVRRSADLARVVVDAEQRRFELGESTVLTLNLREQAAAEARLRVIGALRTYWTATATYRAAVGAPFTAE